MLATNKAPAFPCRGQERRNLAPKVPSIGMPPCVTESPKKSANSPLACVRGRREDLVVIVGLGWSQRSPSVMGTLVILGGTGAGEGVVQNVVSRWHCAGQDGTRALSRFDPPTQHLIHLESAAERAVTTSLVQRRDCWQLEHYPGLGSLGARSPRLALASKPARCCTCRGSYHPSSLAEASRSPSQSLAQENMTPMSQRSPTLRAFHDSRTKPGLVLCEPTVVRASPPRQEHCGNGCFFFFLFYFLPRPCQCLQSREVHAVGLADNHQPIR